ncbi:MAG TPA: tyrosine-type recombinase/integrase [Tepidisphaeraceae bacterium]|nr:tyrosine-type recombinase/integrase [Tepidisphaeraceae bacterium]
MASLKRRGEGYYLQYYLPGKKQRRINLHTDCFQIAKEKLRRFESAQLMGDELPLPTRTPVAQVVSAYVNHIRITKTSKSAQTDTYYLRDAFGPICQALCVTSRKISPRVKKRPPKPGQDRRFRASVIERQFFEQITTADIASFITSRVSSRGLAPKTANRYREILVRLFNWAMSQQGIRVPGGKNPALAVERYRERAPEISFLKLEQIEEQLLALENNLQLQVMVAVLIYAGLRREELIWLTHEDVDFAAGKYGILRIQAKTIGDESWQPKTKINRGVPISSQLRFYLDKWRLKGNKSLWLFPNSKGGRYDPDNFSSDLRALNAKAGLDWTNLDFRHTFGSQLAMKGESLYKIATLMGNSPEICRRHYAALLPESLITSVEFGVTSPRPASAPAISA